MDCEVRTDWAPDRAGVASVPSANPAQIRFSLQNPRNYDLVPALRFTDPAVESSLPVNAYILALSPDRQFIDLQLSSEFLAMHERGGNISFELTFTEPQTQRVFPSYQLALRANTAPPIPAGARVMLDNSTNNYVVCFNLDLSDPLQNDLHHITVNNSVYTISSITTGGTPDITFNESGISTTEPTAGIGNVPDLDGFTVDPGMTQIYVTTGISYEINDYRSFTIQVTDDCGVTRQRTATTGAPLNPVTFSAGGMLIPVASEQDLTPNTIGNASLVMNSPTSGATMHYQIVSNGTPAAPQTSTASSHTITLPEGSHVISAYATQYGFSESVEVSVTIHVIDPARIYVDNVTGLDANRGTLGSPCKTISMAYSKLPVKDNAANTIVLLSDITEVDQPSLVTSNQLAYLDITETTHLTIDGQGLYALDATDVVAQPTQTRGMYLAGSASLDLTLQGLTISNASYWGDGAGLYISNENARVVLDGCVVMRNTANGSKGGGIFCETDSLTLYDTKILQNNLQITGGTACGGGLYFKGNTLIVKNNFEISEISGNTISGDTLTGSKMGAGFYAEGLFLQSMAVTLNGVRIEGNNITGVGFTRFTGNGAGGYLAECTSSFTDVHVSANNITPDINLSAETYGIGAGLYIEGGTHELDSCHINGNTIIVDDESFGAGIYLNNGNIKLTDTEISGNTGTAQDGYGGGIFMQSDTTVTMIRGSITVNSANTTSSSFFPARGDGVYAQPGAGYSATFNLNSGTVAGNQSPGPDGTNTAFYLDGAGTSLVLATAAQIHESNVVYLDNNAKIRAMEFLTADPVATLKFPDGYPTSYFTLVGAPATNYYKFLVEDLSDGPYCINADGNLSKITEASVSTMSDLNSQLAIAPNDGTTVLIELGTGTYTVPGGDPAFSITSDRNIRIIPQGPVSFNNANYSTLFAVSGHLLIDGANLTIDCLGPPTVSRYAPLFDCRTIESSLVARNISIINSGIIAGSDQDGSLVSLQDDSTAVLEVFRYYENSTIAPNSATSALNLGVDSVCHFVSGSIENFNAEHTFSGTVAGVATLPAGATLHIHDGTFTGNSLEGTSSVAGPGTLINDTGIEPQ